MCQNVQSVCSRTSPRLFVIGAFLEEEFQKSDPVDIFMLNETWLQDEVVLKNWVKYDKFLHENYALVSDCSQTSKTSDKEEDKDNRSGKGTAMLIRKALFKYNQQTIRLDGRGTVVVLFHKNDVWIVGTIYAPASAKPSHKREAARLEQQLKNILTKQYRSKKCHVILGGDWNTIGDTTLDTASVSSKRQTTRLVKRLRNGTYQFKMLDAYRWLYPDKKEFSHCKQSGDGVSQSRLDFFLVDEQSLQVCKSSRILDLFLDASWHHRCIELRVDMMERDGLQPASHGGDRIDFRQLSQEQWKKFSQYVQDHALVEDELLNSKKNLDMIKEKWDQVIVRGARKCLPLIKKPGRKSTCTRRKRQVSKIKNWQELCRLECISEDKWLEWDVLCLQEVASKCNNFSKPRNHQEAVILIRETKRLINQIQLKAKKASIRRACRARDIEFFKKQKSSIRQILENGIAFDGLQCVRDEVTQEMITEQDEVLDATKSYYQNLMTERELTAEQKLELESWEPQYQKVKNVMPEWCYGLLDEFTEREISECLSSLPNKKASCNDLTNEHLKLLAENEVVVSQMASMMNATVRLKHIPVADQQSQVHLLPKCGDWNGRLSKIRPITLLTPWRKLFSLLLYNRIKRLLGESVLFQGRNFAFQKKKSTANGLLMIKAAIDGSIAQKLLIYICNFDVQKAYDTLRFDILLKALARLHFDPEMLGIFELLLTSRRLQIRTAFGLTEGFQPTRGLPQGDVMLESVSIGYKLPNQFSIKAPSFADDLSTVANSKEDMKCQIQTVKSFMMASGMVMNVTKTVIHTNDKDLQCDDLGLEGNPIILGAHQTNRYLGVHMSLANDSKPVQDKMLTWLNISKSRLQYRHIPGKIGLYLVNCVILPKLLYQSQFACITKSFIDGVDVILRQIAKRSFRLKSRLPSSLLYAKEIGIGLRSFRFELAKMRVTRWIQWYNDFEGIERRVLIGLSMAITKSADSARDLIRADAKVIHKAARLSLLDQFFSACEVLQLQIRLSEMPEAEDGITDLMYFKLSYGLLINPLVNFSHD
ncbi:hypothetical protein MP228_001297 [Amoeboaphelidium protococcarum]|nr:hypothetical protein MP228_001297 [Amoeboaphelidium protococcarum]